MKRSTYPFYFMSFILLVLVTSTSGCSRPVEHAAVSDEEAGEASQRSAGDSLLIMLPGEVPLELVWIPPGSFMMGSPEDEKDREQPEGPQHEVTFAKGFWMGKYPITQAQWQAVMGNNPSEFIGDNRPVEKVSWNDIRKSGFLGFRTGFLDKINALNTSFNFRLPSEAEWEYAYRAGTTTRFYWGDDPRNIEIVNYAWYAENSGDETHDVGLKLPNAWGLHDMAGTVLEWCEDYWHWDYNGAPNDGSAWVVILHGKSRIIRGGSWGMYPEWSRAAFRTSSFQSTIARHFGFRVVCTLD